ncbi:MAG: hypothetical protein V7641_5017 [Blastocatellia bacterium]
MRYLSRPRVLRYSVALLTVALALFVTLHVELLASRTPFALFFAAVMISSWYGGWQPGLLAIALSALTSEYFIIPPLYSLMKEWSGMVQVSTFVLVALLINWLTAARQQGEKSLRESEARLQTIVENLAEGLAVSDLNGQLLHFNRAALGMHGFANLDEIRRHLTEFAEIFELSALDGAVWPVAQWPLARIMRGETLRDLEVLIRRRQSDWQRVFSYGGSLVYDAAGQPMMAIVTMIDITERKHAEDKVQQLNERLEQRVLERTAQLEVANRELDAFSYSVSHDLRAPLRHLDGFSQALLEDYADKLDAEGQGYLQQVRGASQEMAQLIDDLLQLARVTRSEMRREAVNLSEIARAAVNALQKTNTGRRVAVHIAEGLVTYGDKRLLQVVLNNLLGNAWKFTSERQPAEITFGQEPLDGEAVYFVRDNGAGFDMAYANKLFGAFQRLHTANEFEGTGIGLATVQRIVHRHGGRVWAESKVNQGATFYFTLGSTEIQALP